MPHQILWLEIVLKLGIGLILLAAPRTLAKVLGLPVAEDAFWPRLVGAMLIGLAAAMIVELRLQPGHALGLSGIAAIDLAVGATLWAMLILGRAGSTKRGRLAIGTAAFVLTLLALVSIVSGP